MKLHLQKSVINNNNGICSTLRNGPWFLWVKVHWYFCLLQLWIVPTTEVSLSLSSVHGAGQENTEHWGLFTSLFTVHSSLWPHQTVGLVTNKHDQTSCSQLRYVRGVVGWGLFTAAACRFESVAPPNTKRYFYADCCGVNNSTVLLLRLHFVFQTRGRRPYIPRFSFKTNRRAAGWLVYWWGGGWTLCCAPLWRSWHLNMWLSRSGQKPAVSERAKCQMQRWQRATLAKCVVNLLRRRVWNYE